MNTYDQLVALIQRSNPTAAQLTKEDLVFGTPEVVSQRDRNTQLAITAAPNRGYSGSMVVYYTRRQLSEVYGSQLSIALPATATVADVVEWINQKYAIKLLTESVNVTSSKFQLGEFNPIVFTAKATSLEWVGHFTVQLWLRQDGQSDPEASMAMVLEVREYQAELIGKVDQIWNDGVVVHTVAGFSGHVTREQLGLDKLDYTSAHLVVRQNVTTDDLFFAQPVYAIDAVKIGQADARDGSKSVVLGLVAQSLIQSNNGTGKIHTGGVLAGTPEQWQYATGMVGGLVVNHPYYLDIRSAKLTPFAPSEQGQFLTLIGTAISPTELSVSIERPISL